MKQSLSARLTLCAFIVCVPLFGCGPIVAIPGAASQDAPSTVPDTEAYQLYPGDVIKLTVYGEDVLTGQYTVDQRGYIVVPLIGDTQAKGLTKQQLQDKITAELKKGGYLSKPQVTVDVLSVRPFYIVGEVKNPGSYPWQPSLDALQAIATAGGYTPRAAQNRILIDRTENGKKEHMNATESTPVLPGDSITVRERIL